MRAVCEMRGSMAETARGHVVLVGLMGAGKSTVGRALAAALGRPFLDNDDMLQRRTGLNARDIARRDGVRALHRAEADELVDALASPKPAVIGAAAAAPLEPDPLSALAGAFVVYLCARPEVLEARVRNTGDHHRRQADLAQQFADRDGRYRALANLVVDASRPVEEIVQTITGAVAR